MASRKKQASGKQPQRRATSSPTSRTSRARVTLQAEALSYAISEQNVAELNALLADDPHPDALAGKLEVATATFDEDIMLALIRANSCWGHEADEAYREAARRGSNRVIKELLNEHDVPERPTALEIAIRAGHADLVRILLDADHHTNRIDEKENTALMVALGSGHADIVDTLLEEGVDLDAANDERQTALMLACERGDEDAVAKLLALDVHVESKDYGTERTALSYAVDAGATGIVRSLLDHGADPDEQALSTNSDPRGDTVLTLAANEGKEDICEVLLERGADVNGRSARGSTALHEAAREGHVRLTRLLLGWGANPHKPDASGVTPLMAAAARGKVQTLRIFLNAQVEVDVRDERGNTALMHAMAGARTGNVVAALLDAGAAVGALNAAGDTALMVGAAHEATYDLLDTLKSHKLVKEHENRAGETALTIAVEKANQRRHFFDTQHLRDPRVATISALLSIGCTVDTPNREGDTPLILAARGGNAEVVAELLGANARRDLANRHGQTALDAAVSGGHKKVISLLQ